ncbi:MAG: thioredoxin domain-containing protein [Bdellovibrionota bacterium]
MNKNNKTYILIGIVALLIAGFIVASSFYKSSEKKESSENATLTDIRAKIIGTADRSQGPTTARVVVVEFLDPECESCRIMHPVTKGVLAEFAGQIYYVVRYMPFHPDSVYAASALEAAARQGKFWESLDVLFEKQHEWGAHDSSHPDLIPGYLTALGVDRKRLENDMKDPLIAQRIEQDKTDGEAVGVTGTPTYFINGKMLMELGEQPLRTAIQQELKAH